MQAVYDTVAWDIRFGGSELGDKAYDLLLNFLGSLLLRVMQTVETERPAAALRLYRTHVARLIDQRGRANYAAVAQHLVHMRAIY